MNSGTGDEGRGTRVNSARTVESPAYASALPSPEHARPSPLAARPVASWRRPSAQAVSVTKCVVFVLALLPLARLVAGFFLGRLGVNPIETITHSTGTWTLVFLLITLSVTPLRRITGVNALLRLRRMLGLFAFF